MVAGQGREGGSGAPEQGAANPWRVISATTTAYKSAGPVARVQAFRARLRYALDRPLTPYLLIIGSTLLLVVLGLLMVFSASQILALGQHHSAQYYFLKQLIAALLGLVLLIGFASVPLAVLRVIVYPVMFGVIGALALVAIPGIGMEINGNRNWLDFGFFQFQPSEFAKLALVLWGADLLARKQKAGTLSQWKHLLVPLVPGALLLLALIMVGGDMGTSMILVAMLFAMLWMVGAPLRLFVATVGVAVVVCTALVVTVPHRAERLGCIGVTKLDPEGACFQALHGVYSFALGGPFGSGLGAGVEKWGQLPEAHTDFIFAATGEELGLVGTLSVIGLFSALGYAGIRVAIGTKDPFVRYAAGAATTWITAQAMINLGSALGLLPIAGVPLPLFSYGGSAMLSAMSAIGVLLCLARSTSGAKAALAARSKNSRIRRRLARVLPRRRTTARPAPRPARRER
ncbi:putative lipid II flippase FtsW [Kitasatospora sp. NPDC088548]|uniref:putative lipid II flippase FtsW n=1 Tax=Kitasatospora sp. NPDC088548 TaxID=3364075 RepID=UPI00381B086B